MEKITIFAIILSTIMKISILGSSPEQNYQELKRLCLEFQDAYRCDEKFIKEVKEKCKKKYEIYQKEVSEGEDQFYAEYYAVLKIDRKLDEETARRQARVYCKRINHKRSKVYADYYASLIVGRNYSKKLAKTQANFYESVVLLGGESELYADYYSMLVVFRHIDESTAKRQARIYCHLVEDEEKSEAYADCYADLTVNKEYNDRAARRQSEIYENALRYYSKFYANYYAELITYRIFEKNITDGEKGLNKEFVKNYIYQRVEGKNRDETYDYAMERNCFSSDLDEFE